MGTLILTVALCPPSTQMGAVAEASPQTSGNLPEATEPTPGPGGLDRSLPTPTPWGFSQYMALPLKQPLETLGSVAEFRATNSPPVGLSGLESEILTG